VTGATVVTVIGPRSSGRRRRRTLGRGLGDPVGGHDGRHPGPARVPRLLAARVQPASRPSARRKVDGVEVFPDFLVGGARRARPGDHRARRGIGVCSRCSSASRDCRLGRSSEVLGGSGPRAPSTLARSRGPFGSSSSRLSGASSACSSGLRSPRGGNAGQRFRDRFRSARSNSGSMRTWSSSVRRAGPRASRRDVAGVPAGRVSGQQATPVEASLDPL
jgi:hypothetical protein